MPLEFKPRSSRPRKKKELTGTPSLLLTIPFALLFESALCTHFANILFQENAAYAIKQEFSPSGGMAFAMNFEPLATAFLGLFFGLLGLIVFASLVFFTKRSWFLISTNTLTIAAITWPWIQKSSIFKFFPAFTRHL